MLPLSRLGIRTGAQCARSVRGSRLYCPAVASASATDPKVRVRKTRGGKPSTYRTASPRLEETERAEPVQTTIGLKAAALADGGTPIATVVLRSDKARMFVGGSPLVYSGAIDCIMGRPPPQTGDIVMVAAHNRTVIAWGMYNTTSMFAVRILQTELEAVQQPECALDVGAVVRHSLSTAQRLRAHLQLPSARTDVYRLVNSEADHLSGLTVDMLAGHAVVQSSAVWIERYKAQVVEALKAVAGVGQVVWRPAVARLKDDGLLEVAAEEGDESQLVQVVEHGVVFLASPYGQKTGFYADQRDSRAFIAAAAAGGKTVLDLCCFTGGFSVAAAVAGGEATGVDSSEAAVKLAERSAELNGVGGRCRFVHQEVERFMREAAAAGRQWDIVVLDPPKLAPTRKSLERATVKYKLLNQAALRLVKPGGLFMTCSCSGAVTQSNLLPAMVSEAAYKESRRLRLVRHAGPASDHPTDPSYPEGAYLTNLTYFVS